MSALFARNFSGIGANVLTLLIVITVLSELIAVCCVVHLWRRRVSVFRKVLWTAILLVPIVGPIF